MTWATRISASSQGSGIPAVARVARVFASCALTRPASVARGAIGRLAQAVGLVPGDQAIEHRVEIARLDELGQLVVLEIDPVVGDAALRIVIGADFLASVAGADGGTTNLGQGLLLLRHLAVEEPGHQHFFRLRLVLELRALVLAGDDDRRAA